MRSRGAESIALADTGQFMQIVYNGIMQHGRRLSLPILLFLPVLLVLVVAIGSVFLVTNTSSRSATTALTEQLRVKTARIISQAISDLLRSPERLVDLNKKFLEKSLIKFDDRGALGRLFLAQIRAYGVINYLSYGSTEGWFVGANRNPDTGEILLVSSDQAGAPLQSFLVDEHDSMVRMVRQEAAYDPRQRVWFASGRVAGRALWYPIYKYANFNGLGLGISAPVYDQSRVLQGVVACDISLQQLSVFMKSLAVSTNGLCALLEPAGLVVASNFLPTPFRVKGPELERISVAQTANNPLIAAWDRVSQELPLASGSSVNGSFEITNADDTLLVNWNSIKRDNGLSLIALTVIPAKDYFLDFDLASRWSLFCLIAVIAISSLIIFLLSRRIMQPILALGRQAAVLAAGEDISFEVNSPVAEINYLQETLITMARDLALSREKLESAVNERNAELLETRNQVSLGAFTAAGIAHEVRGPIGNGILAASRLSTLSSNLKDQLDTQKLTQSALTTYIAECTETAAIIQSNLERSAEIAKGFQTVLVDQLGEHKRTICLQEYLDQILFSLKPLLRKEGIKLHCDWGDMVTITMDPGLLSHILGNLVNNAVHHAFGDQWAGSKEITIRVRQEAAGTQVEFADNGCGMNAEIRERIFDPLFTTGKESGNTGLGLPMIRRSILEKTGGSISVASQPGQGSRFLIRFPPDPSVWT